MKQILISFLVLILFGTVSCNKVDNNDLKTQISQYTADEQTIEELYQDVIVSLLFKDIRKAFEDYYGTPQAFQLGQVEVLRVERPNGYRTFGYRIKLKVLPFTGVHNTIAEDHITFFIDAFGEVKVEKFQHIKDY